MTEAEANKLLAEKSAQLMEHFDHVQIMASCDIDGNSHGVYHGKGNWYARVGLAHEFIETNKARIRDHAVKH